MKELFKRLRGDRNIKRLENRSKRIEEQLGRLAKTSKMLNQRATVNNQALFTKLDSISLQLTRVEGQLTRVEGNLIDRGSAQIRPHPSKESVSPNHKHNIDDWKSKSQEGELKFHQKPGIRSQANWDSSNEVFWSNFGFSKQDFVGRRLLDVGAGSKLRGLYFDCDFMAALEPLANDFKKIEWNDLGKADVVVACAAEDLCEDFIGSFDFIFSVNALDHGYDFDKSLQNIVRYLKDENALAFLTFDAHEKTDDLHPLVLTPNSVESSLKNVGFIIQKMEIGPPYHRGISSESITVWCSLDT